MNPTTSPDKEAPAGRSVPRDAAVKAAYAWVNQLGRTLKTCRLYDANNPTVVRFRDELGLALTRLLEQHGAITLRFTSEDVTCEEVSLYPARSRDDNLALPFYRDGVRSMTFTPGLAARELDALLDAVLQVTGQNYGQDDLVTLLWEAQLRNIEIDYVPAEGDFGSGPGENAADESLVPWPKGEEEPEAQAETTAAAGEPGSGEATSGRSDDWNTGDLTAEIEAAYAELEVLAPSEVPRFRREYDVEHAVGPVTTALSIMRAALSAQVNAEDQDEFGRFLPRLLRVAVGRGGWLEAREAIVMLRGVGVEREAVAGLAQELLQPISIASLVERLDAQEPAAVADFIAFARDMDDPGIDVLNRVLAESQQRRTRRLIAEAIAERCRENPERLAPYLADRRWYVVRNVVHILGWIGGNGIVGMLQEAARHPEPRVRHEVVATLGQVEPRVARPLLLKLLEGADTRMFSAVLHQLSAERHPGTARMLMGHMLDPAFEQRTPEEKRAIYGALAATAGDESLAELEAELLKGNWFSRTQEAHRQAVARIIARIGSPGARALLERGLTSRRGPVRTACEQALTGFQAP
jgi:HEAT repeat protein